MELTNHKDLLAINATLKSNNNDEILQVFLSAPYTKQVNMYALALRNEYYELLAHLTKHLPDLSEDFNLDVQKQLNKLNK